MTLDTIGLVILILVVVGLAARAYFGVAKGIDHDRENKKE